MRFHRHNWTAWSEPEKIDRFVEHMLMFGSSKYPVIVVLQERRCVVCNIVEARRGVTDLVRVPEAYHKAFVKA